MTRSDIVKQACEKYPQFPTRALARYILHEHGELWDGKLERIRSAVRYVRGENGEHHRHTATMSVSKAPLPKTWRQVIEPYKMPDGKYLILADIHVPFHEPKPLEAAVEYGLKNNVDAVYLGGDAQDCMAVTFWPTARKREFNRELEAFIEFLDWLQIRIPKVYYKAGNHEYRLPRYYAANIPEMIGHPVTAMETLLDFDGRGIEFIDYNQKTMFGKLPFIHGHEIKSVSRAVNPARGLFLKAKTWAMCAHYHTTSEHTTRDLNGTVITTWSVGCLCHSEDTEVLTENGFKAIGDVRDGEKIAEFDKDSSEITFREPIKRQKYSYKGQMLRFSSKRLDQMVTPEHKMLIHRKDSNWHRMPVSALDLFNAKRVYSVPVSGYSASTDPLYYGDNRDILLAELLGFIITDGAYRKRCNSIRIYQKNFYDRVKWLLDELGIPYTNGKSREIPVFNISATYGAIIREINPVKHQISRRLLSSSRKCLESLYDGLISGDGWRAPRSGEKTTDYFSTHHQECADQFQELCSLIGYTSITQREDRSSTNLCDRSNYIYRCLVRKFDSANASTKETVDYEGTVYDFTTKSGFFMVRRNGKVSVSGNCDLHPDYNPMGTDWNWGCAIIEVKKNGDFIVDNRRILPSGEVV